MPIVALLVCLGPTAHAAHVVYVSADASGANSGSSWVDAFNDLQDAFDAARAIADESDVEIWVSSGIYHPDRGTGDPSASFTLASGMSVYGGFSGHEAVRNERNWETNVTILSGDLLDDDDRSIGTGNSCCTDASEVCDDEACIETIESLGYPGWSPLLARVFCCDLCRPSFCDNSIHVVVGSGVDETAILDGFTITGGEAFDWTTDGSVGAALLLRNSAPIVRNCDFVDNRADGSPTVYASGSSSNPRFQNCAFRRSRVLNSEPFYLNSACVIRNGSATFMDCRFADNGGGGAAVHQASSIVFQDCDFVGNEGGIGGALYVDAPTLCVGCTFAHNRAFSAGAIWVHDSLGLVNCIVRGNAATDRGGAIRGLFGGLEAENCLFAGNRSVKTPSAISVPEYFVANLLNCDIVGNVVEEQFGVAVEQSGTLVMRNTVVHSNRSMIDPRLDLQIYSYDNEEDLDVRYCLIEGWTGEYGGEGNSDDDPLFVAPGHWDNAGTLDDYNDDFWVDGDYHLLPGSPAINAGDPSINWHPWATDLDGYPQELCGEADIGAYEFGIGDADCDQVVTLYDSAFWEYCLTGPPHDDDPWDTEPALSDACKALDFNADNHVDLSDFARYARIVQE